MRAAVADPQECARCHQPLLGQAPPSEPAVAEGVTCDVCHTMREVEPGASRSTFVLDVSNNVKYGPRCNLEAHYFHDMGCSPLHETAEQCAACHNWKRTLASGAELPVLTSYADWLASPYPGEGKQCQDCHMPGQSAILAEGSPEREDVPHHGLLGAEGQLRKRAVGLSAHVEDAGPAVKAAITIINRGAGHYVPTGLPARRLVLRVSTRASDGSVVKEREQSFGRILVDDEGNEVPFYAATRVADDSRIGPRQERVVEVLLDAPRAGELRVELIWRPFSPAIAKALALAEPPADELLAVLTVPLSAPSPKGRAGLPTKVILPP